VLVDVHLYLKDVIKDLKEQVKALFDLMMESAEKHQNVLLPGYTHLQIAMPSSLCGFPLMPKALLTISPC
jgi:argininosuccinate lyase